MLKAFASRSRPIIAKRPGMFRVVIVVNLLVSCWAPMPRCNAPTWRNSSLWCHDDETSTGDMQLLRTKTSRLQRALLSKDARQDHASSKRSSALMSLDLACLRTTNSQTTCCACMLRNRLCSELSQLLQTIKSSSRTGIESTPLVPCLKAHCPLWSRANSLRPSSLGIFNELLISNAMKSREDYW